MLLVDWLDKDTNIIKVLFKLVDWSSNNSEWGGYLCNAELITGFE